MSPRDAALVMFLVLVAASLSPVMQITYATSGSMEPAIPTDSLYVVDTLADSPEPGDILLYESRDGNRVTHRVVRTTADGGYVTRGDANDAPDQSTDAEAVRSDQVIGVVPTVLGRPLVVPGSAPAVAFAGANPIAALLSLCFLFGAGYLFTTGEVERVEVRAIVLPVLAVAFVATVVFFSIGATHPVAFLGTAGPHEGNPELVPADRASSQTLHLRTSPPPLVRHRVVSATGALRVVGTEEYADGTNVTVRVPGVPDNAVERGEIIVNFYPPVVPSWMLSTLHGVHPLLASVVTVSLCYLPLYLLYLVLVDPRKRLRQYVTRGGAR